MSWTTMPNAMTQGVRRLQTLGWLGSVPDPDTLAQLQAAGYDMGLINTAVALGATDEQLLALPFPASPQEISNASQQLLNQLSGNLPPAGSPASSAYSYPVAAQPQYPVQGTQVQNSLKASGGIPVGIFSTTPPATVQANQLQAGQGLISSAVYGAQVTGNALPGMTIVPTLPVTPLTFEQWLSANATWLVILFGALVLGPPLIKKL